jgi:uncharacterized membrane protein
MMGVNVTSKRVYLIAVVILVGAILCVPSFSAQEYYANVSITVDSSGFVTIAGETNHPDLVVQDSAQYTSKHQGYWVLNITKNDMFSDFVYVLSLPAGTSINYIKSSGYIRIEQDQGGLVIRGFGQNDTLAILIQYQIQKTLASQFSFDMMYIVFLIAIIVLILLLVIFVRRERKKTTEATPGTDQLPGVQGLNKRQQDIMALLLEKNSPLTQTDIQKELQIPKAAVSRNIRGLERKGLVEKEQIGMSNLIRVKKP